MTESAQRERRRLYWEELVKAYQRIGHTSSDTMKWVLEFSQQDEKSLSEGDWSNLGYEITYLARVGAPHPGSLEGPSFIPSGDWSKHLSQREVDRLQIPSTFDQVRTVSERPSREAVKELRELARKCLQDLLERKETSIELSGKITRFVAYRPHSGEMSAWTSSNVKDGFLNMLMDIFAIHGNRLGRCQDCGRAFLANRSDQKFCGPRCQSRAGTERFRKTKQMKKLKRKGKK